MTQVLLWLVVWRLRRMPVGHRRRKVEGLLRELGAPVRLAKLTASEIE